jgi:myo-inositol catabolism protein IolC
VGRTLWHDALVDHLAGRSSEAEAAKVIAERYRKLIDIYNAASTSLTAVAP